MPRDAKRFPGKTGSAADYDKPSLHAVGTGKDAQVYGWGLYGSESEMVARKTRESRTCRTCRTARYLPMHEESISYKQFVSLTGSSRGGVGTFILKPKEKCKGKVVNLDGMRRFFAPQREEKTFWA